MKYPHVSALILANGSGVRFQADKLKTKIAGRSLPVDIIEERLKGLVGEILVVGPGRITGGTTRQESVKRGVQHVKNEWVLLIDAARFLVDADDFDNLISFTLGIYEEGAAIDAVAFARPVTNTVLKSGIGGPFNLKREHLFETHTPHMFDVDVLNEIICDPLHDFYPDEWTFAALSGRYVCATLKGNWRTALKLTYPEDLEIMERLFNG